MGIITAFVNQIGREAARDVYRGVKSKINKIYVYFMCTLVIVYNKQITM